MVTKKTIIYTKNDWLIGSSVYTEDPTNTKMFKHKKCLNQLDVSGETW